MTLAHDFADTDLPLTSEYAATWTMGEVFDWLRQEGYVPAGPTEFPAINTGYFIVSLDYSEFSPDYALFLVSWCPDAAAVASWRGSGPIGIFRGSDRLNVTGKMKNNALEPLPCRTSRFIVDPVPALTAALKAAKIGSVREQLILDIEKATLEFNRQKEARRAAAANIRPRTPPPPSHPALAH